VLLAALAALAVFLLAVMPMPMFAIIIIIIIIAAAPRVPLASVDSHRTQVHDNARVRLPALAVAARAAVVLLTVALAVVLLVVLFAVFLAVFLVLLLEHDGADEGVVGGVLRQARQVIIGLKRCFAGRALLKVALGLGLGPDLRC
jgi:hypothetical protein